MGRKSAGLLLYRESPRGLEVFLVHPGGPMWAKKDEGAWSIPKGEFADDEDPFTAAKREFAEETGCQVCGEAMALEPLRQPSAKIVYAWAMRGDLDALAVRSNKFSMEWPPKSGRRVEFPEVDRAAWFDLAVAREKLLKGQVGFLDELVTKLGGGRVSRRRDEAAS